MNFIKKICIRLCWYFSLLLPIRKNKIVFCSFSGRGYSDNPKSIAEELIKSNKKLKLIWLVKNNTEASTLPKEIIPCKYDSIKKIWALATARVWVDNCRKYDKYKKKNQYYIQTWHGFPLKRIEKDAENELPNYYVKNAINDSKKIDLLLSNSKFVTDTLKRCFWYNGKIAEYGFPRNDIFFKDNTYLNEKVKNYFSIQKNRNILLYAPTFRNNNSIKVYSLDAKKIQKACSKRFGGKWTILVRLHPNIAEQSKKLFKYDKQNIIDATMFPDMQELLCASDILITDYSSSMFDFALNKKTCFRLAFDIKEYTKERNFYFPLDKIPFPLANTNEELEKIIENFDNESYIKNLVKWYNKQKFYDDGNASKRCAEWILSKTKRTFN